MSPSASPAKDCPRITVNIPTAPDTTAATAPTTTATCTTSLAKNPGSITGASTALGAWPPTRALTRRSPAREHDYVVPVLADLRSVGLIARSGDDEHAPVHVQDVDVAAVQLAEHVRAHDLLGGAARGASGGEVDDAIHHRQQRVHLVGADQHRDLALVRDPREQRRRPPGRLRRSRLASGSSSSSSFGRPISAWAISTRCCSPPESRPTRASAKSPGVDRVEHLLHERPAGARWQRDAQPVRRRGRGRRGRGRAAACPGRAGTSAGRSRSAGCVTRPAGAPVFDRAAAVDQHPPGAGGLQAEDHPEQRRLAGAVRSDQPGELARRGSGS